MDITPNIIKIQSVTFHPLENGRQKHEFRRLSNRERVSDSIWDSSGKENKLKLLLTPLENKLFNLISNIKSLIWRMFIIPLTKFKEIKICDIFLKNTGKNRIHEKLIYFV